MLSWINLSVYQARGPSVDPRAFRLRDLLTIAFAALLTAGVLRHVLHVYGGISREDIRLDALLFALVGTLAMIFWRKTRKQ